MTRPPETFGPAARSRLEVAIRSVEAGVVAACRRAGRRPDDVTLVGATKEVPVEVVRWARAFGMEHFGENYAGELAAKDERVQATWHFWGKLQRGTAARVADHAAWIHSGEPGEGLDRVAKRAEKNGRRLRCFVQIDFTGHRQGVPPAEAASFLQQATELPAVTWMGLMTIPPWTGDPESSRPYFGRLRELRDDLRERWEGLQELSMGMSGDYEVAVEEGATMLRLGTALFGSRPVSRPSVQ